MKLNIVIWMDYSQNIAFTPKFEVQSSHFSGKQHTLHCTIIKDPKDGKVRYLYHLSEDTNHDSVMTFSILEDLVENHPEIISTGTLVLRSDNCTCQYKSKYVFQKMKELANKYNITIIWVYGEAGHGRGLIDAMSCFGCKGPLCAGIITKDLWFNYATEMCNYLRYFSRMITTGNTMS